MCRACPRIIAKSPKLAAENKTGALEERLKDESEHALWLAELEKEEAWSNRPRQSNTQVHIGKETCARFEELAGVFLMTSVWERHFKCSLRDDEKETATKDNVTKRGKWVYGIHDRNIPGAWLFTNESKATLSETAQLAYEDDDASYSSRVAEDIKKKLKLTSNTGANDSVMESSMGFRMFDQDLDDTRPAFACVSSLV